MGAETLKAEVVRVAEGLDPELQAEGETQVSEVCLVAEEIHAERLAGAEAKAGDSAVDIEGDDANADASTGAEDNRF